MEKLPNDMTKSEFAVYIAQRLTAIHSESFALWQKEIGWSDGKLEDPTKLHTEKSWALENYNSGLSTARDLVMSIAKEMKDVESSSV